MSVLAYIPRPLEQALKTQKDLAQLNIKSIVEPLITIKQLPLQLAEHSSQNQCLLVTSAYAIESLNKCNINKKTPLMTIGEHTTETAKENGFENIIKTGNTSDDLISYIKQYHKNNTRYLYIAADITANNLEQIFNTENIPVKKIVAYKAIPATHFSKELVNTLKENKIQLALFLSQRTSNTFYTCIKKHRLEKEIGNIELFCLSKKIAVPFNNISKIHIPGIPTYKSLLELIAKFKFTSNR